MRVGKGTDVPLLRIETSAALDADTLGALCAEASARIAGMLGKPESVMMVVVREAEGMTFGGDGAPAAFVELRAIGLPEGEAPALSEAICGLVESHIDVPPERVFVNFADVPGRLWGWNGGTL